jgi:hypothetical protein
MLSRVSDAMVTTFPARSEWVDTIVESVDKIPESHFEVMAALVSRW